MIKTKRVPFDSVSEVLKDQIFEHWVSEVENSSALLSKNYNLSEYIIIRIINEGLGRQKKTA